MMYPYLTLEDETEIVHSETLQDRITKSGKCMLANNNSGYDSKTIHYLSRAIEANINIIVEKWIGFFGDIKYFC